MGGEEGPFPERQDIGHSARDGAADRCVGFDDCCLRWRLGRLDPTVHYKPLSDDALVESLSLRRANRRTAQRARLLRSDSALIFFYAIFDPVRRQTPRPTPATSTERLQVASPTPVLEQENGKCKKELASGI